MTIQMTEERATCSPRSISGRASTTIVVSTAVMSTPVMTTTMARPVWEVIPVAPVPDFGPRLARSSLASPGYLDDRRRSLETCGVVSGGCDPLGASPGERCLGETQGRLDKLGPVLLVPGQLGLQTRARCAGRPFVPRRLSRRPPRGGLS